MIYFCFQSLISPIRDKMQERPQAPGEQAQPHEADVPDQGMDGNTGHLPGQQQARALRPLLLQRPAIVVKNYLK